MAGPARHQRQRLILTVVMMGCIGGGVLILATSDTEVRSVSGASGADPGEPAPIDLRTDVVVDPASFARPWGTEVDGLLTFRGNPTRSYHGRGPLPAAPKVAWSFPDAAMCGPSSEGGVRRTWCGNGWTGQPAVFERDGRTWVVFGAYDHNVHFVDGATGERILPDFPTGDIVKGSPTIDPDGYPIVYIGSRDNNLRAIAFDRAVPTELWKLNAKDVGPTMWNDDWDGSPLVINDYLLEGGENSRFHIAKLNRGYGADGLVTVRPDLVFHTAGWDDELLRDLSHYAQPTTVSIEESVTVANDTAWFANSGGLLQGWDVSFIRTGQGTPTRTFRFWLGDDADASVVADDEGFLYAGVEFERGTDRATAIGQMVKIDPRHPDNPVVWSVHDDSTDKSGTWSTPAVLADVVIWPTRSGTVYGLDRRTGAALWKVDLPGPIMGSPVVVDGVWIQGDCDGRLHGFDVSHPKAEPSELWSVRLGGCIEATPAVWKGHIYVGTRAGLEYALE